MKNTYYGASQWQTFMAFHYYSKEKVWFKAQWKAWKLPPNLSARYKLYFSYQLLLSLSLIQISSSIYKCLASKHQLRQLVIIISFNTDEFIQGEAGRGTASHHSAVGGLRFSISAIIPREICFHPAIRMFFGRIRNSTEDLCCQMFLDSCYRWCCPHVLQEECTSFPGLGGQVWDMLSEHPLCTWHLHTQEHLAGDKARQWSAYQLLVSSWVLCAMVSARTALISSQ